MTSFCMYIGRPFIRALLLFILLFCQTSCSRFNFLKSKKSFSSLEAPSLTDEDYRDHLASLSENIFSNGHVKKKSLSQRNKNYLKSIFERVVANNELLLSVEETPKFTIIRSNVPFIFSLPKYQFFISQGLVKKYFRNEAMLVSALTYEIIKSGRDIYNKAQVVPVGTMTIAQLISLTKIELATKMEIYKWTYYALRRSEYDGAAVLNWIQTQNKNTLDFSWQINDPRGVTREESLFKNFLASKGDQIKEVKQGNSSRQFYILKDSL